MAEVSGVAGVSGVRQEVPSAHPVPVSRNGMSFLADLANSRWEAGFPGLGGRPANPPRLATFRREADVSRCAIQLRKILVRSRPDLQRVLEEVFSSLVDGFLVPGFEAAQALRDGQQGGIEHAFLF